MRNIVAARRLCAGRRNFCLEFFTPGIFGIQCNRIGQKFFENFGRHMWWMQDLKALLLRRGQEHQEAAYLVIYFGACFGWRFQQTEKDKGQYPLRDHHDHSEPGEELPEYKKYPDERADKGCRK